MIASPLQQFVRSVLEGFGKTIEDESKAYLVVDPIIAYLKLHQIPFGIKEFPLDPPFNQKYFACCAQIEPPGGSAIFGYSSGTSRTARAIALIESFERYCFREIASNRELAGFSVADVQDVERLDHLWAERVFGVQIIVSRRFFLGTRIVKGTFAAVDEVFICGDDQQCPSTTSGIACHQSYPQAALAACLEIYERDTLLRNWFAGISPTQIEVSDSSLEVLANDLVSSKGFSLELVGYLTELGIPICIATLRSEDERLFFWGSGSSLTWAQARSKAIREVLSIWIFDYLGQKKLGQEMILSDENQIRRYAPHYDRMIEFFVTRARGSAPIQGVDFMSNEVLAGFFLHYDFALVPIVVPGLNGDAPVIVKAFSPKAVSLFKKEFPLVLPADFAMIVQGREPFHPY